MRGTESGFTIIELMIATAIFAVVLLITTTTIIGISNTYIKGSVEDQTQQSARAILSDISQDIEFNDLSTINTSGLSTSQSLPSGEYFFCVGNDVYAYTLDKVLSSQTGDGDGYSPWGLVRYYAPSCPQTLPASPNNITGVEELLSSNERVGGLDIEQITLNGTTAYTITIEIGYGTDALLQDSANGGYVHGADRPPASYPYNYKCQSGLDSSFCSVSSLTTTVAPRINY